MRNRADNQPGPLRRLIRLYEEAYHGPQRRLLARRARREEDLLRLLALSEALGGDCGARYPCFADVSTASERCVRFGTRAQ